jgi:hypothetical protein
LKKLIHFSLANEKYLSPSSHAFNVSTVAYASEGEEAGNLNMHTHWQRFLACRQTLE